MPKMSPGDLRALLAAEKADALSAMSASKLSEERAAALDYYLGDMSRDMPASDGRSKAVSTDVSDTVEGLMPSLMEIFTAGDEVVRFEPVGPEDVQGAEQETDYINHVFMQQNPGFLVLYSFIKDALLSKVGVVKVWWEAREEHERETYLDQPADAFALIVANPAVEVIAHSEHDGLHDVTVQTRRSYQCARVEGVPPEEFGISRNARCIRDADYCFHDVLKSEAKLIEQGYDRKQVKRLPSCSVGDTIEAQARDTVDEGAFRQGDEGLNSASRLIRVTEHYVRMDYEGNDKPALYRVTTAGEEAEVLERDGEPDVIQEDAIPFAAMTPVIVTHRFFGRSIADLVMDIQRIKTALLRALLDNAYLANNPRTEVAESHATETTLDDLLVSRPGGIVRTKMPGGLAVIQHPDIGGHVFPLLQYQDATREWRTGVSRQGQGVDPNALQNQVATIANQMFNASQAKIKLIARIFAETGIRNLFSLLHGVIRRNGSQAQTVRLRNQWVNVDPRDWKERNDMTINVGLGTGSKSDQLAHMTTIIALQKEALAGGLSHMVTVDNLYNSAKEVVKLVGLKTVDRFFTDPKGQTPPPARPDPGMAALQAKSEIEKTQALADIETQKAKAQSEIALAERKFELERQLRLLDAAIQRDSHSQAMAQRMARGLVKPRAASEVGTASEGAEATAAPSPDPTPLIAELLNALKSLTAPKRVVYGANGEPLNRRTILVPKGRGPFEDWAAGAVDALALDGLDQVKAWTPERACFEIERFNGFGYRKRGINSPYLWSFSNHYERGKYVADGRFSPTHVDQQCGAIPVLKRIMELDETARFKSSRLGTNPITITAILGGILGTIAHTLGLSAGTVAIIVVATILATVGYVLARSRR